jgi:hypothetical protein
MTPEQLDKFGEQLFQWMMLIAYVTFSGLILLGVVGVFMTAPIFFTIILVSLVTLYFKGAK